jgi:nucleotide-binding universal stress UspA family protein
MSIAKIIVPVTGAERDSAALAAAFAAAKPFNAHVVAVIVHPDPRLSVPFMGTPLSPQLVQNLVDAAAEMNVAATKAARTGLAAAARTAGVDITDHPRKADAVTCSFAEMEGFFAGSVAKAARLSDLVVFGPIATAYGPDLNECFVEILTRTDKPVLLSANGGKKLTRSIAVAWDGGSSACHAITGAMPFLKRAEAVTILHVGEPLKDWESGFSTRSNLGELKEYLSLHGITPAVQNFERGAKSTGEALLDAALSIGAELLVMGGYGHSRLRETIFGGVTAHIRWHAELPVLMVH